MSDATNLVEKVARAMCENNVLEKHDWDKLPENKRDWWRSDARFAIAVVVEEAKRVLMEDCHDDMTRDEEAEAIRKAFLGDAK